MKIDWYFDFISPFAYLANERLAEFEAAIEVRRCPVLFAGLLDHWGQRGPAEIPGKRIHTYQYSTWLAAKSKIPFAMPARHPFNPLPYLRLATAYSAKPDVVDRIFRFLWIGGGDPADPERIAALTETLAAAHGPVDPTRAEIKRELREATEQATTRGVFGVPTTVLSRPDRPDALLWGLDSVDMLHALIETPDLLSTPEMTRIASLPVAAERKAAPFARERADGDRVEH